MEFHETEYGRRFFGQQLPDLIDSLKALNATMLNRAKLKEELYNLREQIRKDFPDLIDEDSVQADYVEKLNFLIQIL